MINIKHIRNIGLAGILLATTFVSCTDEWDNAYYLKSNASEYITFAADDSPISASVTTRSSSGHLETVAEEWSLVAQEKATTRVAPTSSLNGMTAGLIGYTYAASLTDLSNLTTPWASMDNAEYSFITQKYALTSATPVMWNTIPVGSDSLRVYAYTPKSFVGSNATLQKESGIPTITYTIPNDGGTPDYTEQLDLLSAVNSVHKNYKDSIPLTFKHALTGIQFKIGFAATVKSISISGVYKKGTYKLGDFSNSAWTPEISGTPASDVDTYTISFNNGEGSAFAANDMITGEGSTLGAASTLMLIPQTLPDGATVSLVYNDGSDHTISASIMGNTWQPNKLITYTIYKEEAPSYIYFDLAAGNISISSSSYSGYVYINGTTTTQIVSGTHNSSNKYYVYQSSTDPSSAGYYGITGFRNGVNLVNSKFDGIPIDGKDVTLPNYQELRTSDNGTTWALGGSSGITWREYITDHHQSEDIIDLWNDSGTNHPFMNVQKRSASTNRITVSGGTVDITIDNLLCSNNSINGTAPFIFSGSTTLRLKGDSFVTKMIASCGGYFHLTSYKGDGSEEGSITITPFSRTFANSVVNPQSAIMFTNTTGVNDNMDFRGGTVYAATTLSTKDRAYRWVNGGITASSNSIGRLKISGGAVTVVAHSIAAAIGGGGGMIGQAGSGYVKITGGRTFAYQKGVTTNTLKTDTDPSDRGITGVYQDYTYPLSSTAIGGGSTFAGNPTTTTPADYGLENGSLIEIEGDAYVYAESVGGVAIGGGSSGGLRGGIAEIKIGETGNPTVIAKSVEGDIVDPFPGGLTHHVYPGTAIGGGNGGNEDHKVINSSWNSYETDHADGGLAKVTIYGGRVYTGSIGGGNAGTASGGTIQRKLGSADITVSGGTIQGQFVMQAQSSATDLSPVFNMTGGTIDNSGLLVSQGFSKVKNEGGAVYIGAGAYPGTFTMTSGTIQNSSATLGGAVYMGDGTFNMSGGTIENSSAPNGGAVYIASGGVGTPTFTMSGTAKIQRSTATSGQGGALNMEAGNVTINGSSVDINNCSSTADGGAIYVASGTLNMQDGTFYKNRTSAGNGGAISLTGGIVTMSGGTISGNTSAQKGGGVYINNGTFSMSDGSITGNAAKQNGGGVAVSSGANLTIDITGGFVTANTTQEKGGGISVEPTSTNTVTMNIGDDVSESLVNPAISGNGAAKAGAGIYISGSTSTINIKNGKVKDNNVSAIVDNDDVENENGKVNLTGGDVNDVMVIYHRNDGSTPDKTSMQRVLKNANSNLICPSNMFTHPASKTFKKWTANADGTGEVYTDGQLVKINTTLHIYAQWND